MSKQMDSLTLQRGKVAKRIIRNPDDGSYNCLEKAGRAWETKHQGVSDEVAADFIKGAQIIEARV